MTTDSPLPGRAGRYVLQPNGYRAFMPTPLPPNPPVQMRDRSQALLSDADRALGRLDGSIQTLPDADMFVFMYVRREAVLSSQIEGTQSSLDNLLAAEAQIYDPERPRDVDEVINYVAAMNYGLEQLATLPVSVRLICDIHERLLRNVRGAQRRPGELRNEQNWIGGASRSISDAVFVPPPPETVPQALADLERFLHSESPMPSLVKVDLAHAQFETIHPFLDGNGRMGRLLITFLLCERNILAKPVLYLSHYFRQNRQEYYEHLQATRDAGNWEDWIDFFLQGLTSVAQEATVTVRSIVALRELHRALITERFGRATAAGLRLLEYLYAHPIITVNNATQAAGVSYPSANGLVARLVEHGLLAEYTGQSRNRRYIYEPYVAIFRDDNSGPSHPDGN